MAIQMITAIFHFLGGFIMDPKLIKQSHRKSFLSGIRLKLNLKNLKFDLLLSYEQGLFYRETL